MQVLVRVAFIGIVATALAACVAVDVATTAVDVTATAVKTTAHVGAAVVDTAADAVSGDSDKDDDKDKKKSD